jgi:predicted homoserine dehydrogenase-like protein
VVNVKGLHDPYRNPTTQKGWAERWGQNAAMVTSFADGSKISFEQTIVANATGFKVLSRGMSRGRKYDGSIMDVAQLYDLEQLRALGGVVDYTVGPPLIKAFARVVLFGDELAPPLGGPVVEVCAVAKRDLQAGEVLDEYGMYCTYGEAVNVEEMSAGQYLPEGLVEGCRLKRPVAKDQVITYADVELPEGRIADRLRAEQYVHFRGETWLQDLLESQGQPRPSSRPEVRAPGAAASPA